jgi:hypothetical protein
MRAAAFALLISLSGAAAAHAEPAQEAGSAMGACLAAVIDNAPVEDIRGQDVSIHRESNPNACTVSVTAGDPAAVRTSVLAAVTARRERFTPAATQWDPAEYATRETFCDLATRKPYNVIVSTAHPGAQGLVLTATAVESRERDERCDRDAGLQRVPFH